MNPHVHLLGDDAACIAYVRLTQYIDKYVIIFTRNIFYVIICNYVSSVANGRWRRGRESRQVDCKKFISSDEEYITKKCSKINVVQKNVNLVYWHGLPSHVSPLLATSLIMSVLYIPLHRFLYAKNKFCVLELRNVFGIYNKIVFWLI